MTTVDSELPDPDKHGKEFCGILKCAEAIRVHRVLEVPRKAQRS